MPNHLAAQADPCVSDTDDLGDDITCTWSCIPDNLLLIIFTYLQPYDLLIAAKVCKQWNCISVDDLLWKELLYRYWSIKKSIPRVPGRHSWLGEFKRLYCRTPVIETEVLKQHRDQVLHVTFSHNGKLISSCSKDGFIKVWNSTYPISLKYFSDMRELTWKYTQFSQFNQTDKLLLVSGVHFGSNSTSGEIVIFNLENDKFELQCRVLNKPYDVFGTWYNNDFLLSGNIHWQGNYTSCSALWLNKASQALESEHESVVLRIYKFFNINASSVRTITVANCKQSDNIESSPRTVECPQNLSKDKLQETETNRSKDGTIEYGKGYINLNTEPAAESATYVNDDIEDDSLWNSGAKDADFESKIPDIPPSVSSSSLQSSCSCNSQSSQIPSTSDITPSVPQSGFCEKCQSNCSDELCDKFLIFTMGTKTYTPHQIGIKRIAASEAEGYITRMKYRQEGILLPPRPYLPEQANNDVNFNAADIDLGGLEFDVDMIEMQGALLEEAEFHMREEQEAANHVGDELLKYDKVDHLIELHGHIIGMCLSPDDRYLYVNSRPWPKDYIIQDPLCPPPIAQEIDIHVIDLLTMEEVGTMLRSHKAYTPNDECFFIFLDVSNLYVASGAENNHGYLWDRHYGVCLTKFPHNDVVNCVAFNPVDAEMLVTASDDHTLKVWHSRDKAKSLPIQTKKAVSTVSAVSAL